MSDWTWLKNRPEGQFLERKSCYHYARDKREPRPIKEIVRDLAETLVAMANADGGTVVLGAEDDGTPTGIPERLEWSRVRAQLDDLIRPRLRYQYEETVLDGQRIWVITTDWSPEVHQLSDGRYLLRVGAANLPFPAGDLEAMKTARRQRVTEEQFLPEATLGDLDLSLVARLSEKGGVNLSPEETLLHYRLVERVNGQWRLTLAALLLFGKDPGRWHPRCGIEFVQWRGTERRTGADLNIIKRIRLEAPLVLLIERAYQTIQTYLPERQHLVDLFFTEQWVYPTFAWQEAIVNAVAHRDYQQRGRNIEVHLFDDRLEIRSPGELVEPVTLERLYRRERVHQSRNPRIVRVLVDFGYMRELGEGIPRMFEVMEREGLRPPEFSLEGGAFVVTLRSEPLYSPRTMRWLRQFEGTGLNPRQVRLLAYAYEHDGQFTSHTYQRLVGIDPYTASRDIRDLVRKGLARLKKPRGRVYEVSAQPTSPAEKPPDFIALEPILKQKGFITNRDIREALGVSPQKARYIAAKLTNAGWLEAEGEKRGRRYRAIRRNINTS